MAKDSKSGPAIVEDEETEEYLKYVIKDCTINITVNEGGQVILQTGHPVPFPPPK